MAYSNMAWETVNVANTAKLSSAIDLRRIYDFIQIDVPTLDATTLFIDVARTGGTHHLLSVVNAVDVTTGNTSIVMNIHGHQFLKINCANTQTANRSFYYRAYAI